MAAQTFKTKPFCIAVAGATVDGRTLDAKAFKEMADSYDPVKSYAARVNCEHIRGISAEPPFNAYGDLISLSVGKKETLVGGKTVEADALFGQFEFLANAKALHDKGQKVFPSIEINHDFRGQGHAYCMGIALTDSPASAATDRVDRYSRTIPGNSVFSANEANTLEFVEEAIASTAAADTFLAKLGDLLKSFSAKPAPAVIEPAKGDAVVTDDNFVALATAMQDFAQSSAAAIAAQAEENRKLREDLSALSTKIDTTAAPGHVARPLGTGPSDQYSTDFV